MPSSFLSWLHGHLNILVLFGLIGQALFMMRFIAQWVASEKSKRSVMPEIFWYFSLGGGLILFIYAILKNDIVFILGQGTGLFIYIRNVIFIWRAKAKQRGTPPEAVVEDLLAIATELSRRQAQGEPLTPAEHKAAAEALHMLEAGKK